MSSLKIVALFEVTNETKASVIKSLLDCTPPSRAEEGNDYYNLTESTEDPNLLIIIEQWKSQEAIDFHNTTPHFKKMIQEVEGNASVKIHILKDVE